ncbi:MAG: O-antigen ligase domain-containing protein [Deltaproteobacteria bacterium]|nr:O-antigen ligase domain-containing protein [Deltaproteobacteria bacterium]MBW2017936.1 O-antigen ligase domain-containing protein [Deltaproteobacteria bacterium]MBW2127904.1 O-antigen ligase domain-containing protein [Deltaproteobacteria bacterium]MBW2304762.1 O-antigen ligase domain-containing protein [Deltaproteobacteria bacterium]
MNLFVHIAMFGWIPVVIALFSRLRPRHAVIVSFLTAWLFLPNASYSLAGLPDYTKMSATCWGILLGALLFDRKHLFSFRVRWVDLPMIVWCLCPAASSLSNGLGLYDGLSSALRQTVTWGLPYMTGRIYFKDLEGLREFALGIFIGGLIYVPLCLYEIRMSPQLHYILYGFYQHSFVQTFRYGGWRPMVFLEHGLMVGTWMAGASLIGLWIWASGGVRRLLGIPVACLLPLLLLTTVLIKSTGALFLLALGTALLFLSARSKKPLLVFCLVAVPVLYMTVRITGSWSGGNLVSFVSVHINEERAKSLAYRFRNENLLTEKALIRPVFGWGGWGRSRVYDEQGKDISVTDGLWVIALGTNGLVGLVSLTSSILMPLFVVMRRYRAEDWLHPAVAPAVALAALLGLYMIDNLPNAMVNPIFMVGGGGITALLSESLPSREDVPSRSEPFSEEALLQPRFL